MKRWGRWVLAGLGLLVIGLGIWLWPVVRAFIKVGLPEGPEMRKYEGTSQDNLKAIRTALLLYHDNEDRFPDAAGWMDAIEGQLKTNDLTPDEARKKLRNPRLSNAGANDFGYAINDAVAGKYRGDIKDGKTVLVFESDDRRRNAHGSPEGKKGQAITLDGTVLRVP